MNLKTSILILLVVSGFFILVPDNNDVCAQTIAQQTCDTQVWRAMENRARIETEREIMQNQNLIFKADSILSYTCFDSFAAHAAQNVGPLFTHTTYFTGSQVIQWGSPNGMDYALDRVVIGSMAPYIESNFGHAYLGGRGEFVGLGRPVTNRIPSRGATYDCSVMSEVWRVAKCLNFIHTQDFATTDGFFPFIDIVGIDNDNVIGYANEEINDTRRFPTACSGTPITGSTWSDMYRESRNERDFGNNDALYQYGTPLRETFQAVRLLVQPAQCGSPLPTGVTVIPGVGLASQAYPDAICTNPGCSYRRGDAGALGTCSTAPPAVGGGGGGGGGGNPPASP